MHGAVRLPKCGVPPDARTGALVILPGAGHVGPLLQAAPQVAQLVTAFWDDPQRTIKAQDSTRPAASAG